MIKPQAIIFDMDGVIIDSEPIYFEIQKKIFTQLQLIVPADEYDEFIGVGMHRMWQILKKNHQLDNSITDLVKINNEVVYESFKNMTDLQPMPHFVSFIEKCSAYNLKIALASSTAKRTILAILNNLAIQDYFEIIVSGEEVKNGKPAPDIFLSAARQIDVEPAQCVVIEDSTNGIRGAKKAGMYCIGLCNPDYPDQNLSAADVICENFQQIDFHIFR